MLLAVNENYILNLDYGDRSELEKAFMTLFQAKNYGQDRFPQNEWHIADRRSGAVLHRHNPLSVFEREASQEITRIAARDAFIQGNLTGRFQQRIQNVALRQRQMLEEARRYQEDRARRLSGFGFVNKTTKPPEKINWKKEGF